MQHGGPEQIDGDGTLMRPTSLLGDLLAGAVGREKGERGEDMVGGGMQGTTPVGQTAETKRNGLGRMRGDVCSPQMGQR